MESLTAYAIILLILAAGFFISWLAMQRPRPSARGFWIAFKWAVALGLIFMAVGQIAPKVKEIKEEIAAERTRQATEFWTLYSKVPPIPDPDTCTPQNSIELTWNPSNPYFYPLHKCLDLATPTASGEPLVVVISRRPDDAGIMPIQKLASRREIGIVGPEGGWNIFEVNKGLFDDFGWFHPDYYALMIFKDGKLTLRGENCKPGIVDYAEVKPTWAGTEKQLWPIAWPRGKNRIKLFVPAGSKIWLSVNSVKCPDYLMIDGEKILARPDEILGTFKFWVYVENR